MTDVNVTSDTHGLYKGIYTMEKITIPLYKFTRGDGEEPIIIPEKDMKDVTYNVIPSTGGPSTGGRRRATKKARRHRRRSSRRN